MSLPLASFWVDLLRLITLQEGGTRVTMAGVTLLGIAGGVVGSFLLLRKRALVGDALAHATYPGICAAFMLSYVFTGVGRSLPWLLAGATIAGLIGVACMLAIRHLTRLKEDAALGLVLGTFFGAGVVLNSYLATGAFGAAAGIRTFLEGQPAALLANDAWLIFGMLGLALAVCGLLFKELRLLCFDAGYAQSQGWPTLGLDLVLMALVTLVVVVGLQAVGLILVIAMLVIPSAAARFWTERLGTMCLVAGLIGGVSGVLGTAVSALMWGWPAGASIVLAAAAVFTASMIFGPSRGLLMRFLRGRQLAVAVADDNLLRGVFELREADGGLGVASWDALHRARSWSRGRLRRIARRAQRRGLVRLDSDGVALTELGEREARRVVRNHRLWELYMITHADVALSHVDRGADMIEHVLGEEIVRKLEGMFDTRLKAQG